VVVIDHTARAGKLYMGESENSGTSFKRWFCWLHLSLCI